MGPVLPTSTRPYRGVQPEDRLAARRTRLLDAGLSILGSGSGGEVLTVRGVCRQASVAARYFYESFTDKDALVGAVFDWVIEDLAASAQRAMAAAPPAERTRACMANIVGQISEDPRVGRLIFSADLADPVLLRKRAESGALLAMLSVRHASEALRVDTNDRIKAAGHFVVGGVGQTLGAWLHGKVTLDREQLVSQLTSFVELLGDPALYR